MVILVIDDLLIISCKQYQKYKGVGTLLLLPATDPSARCTMIYYVPLLFLMVHNVGYY